jgi:hypothetical protein
MPTASRARRPFWIHQLAEYIIGLVLVSSGLQAPDPIVPCIAGGLVLVNAAVVAGPLGAFDLVPRRWHAVLDVVVIAVVVGAAVQPWWSVDNATRLIMVGAAVVLGFVTFYTDFAERRQRRDRRAAAAATGERVGRSAGRLAGTAVTAWRQRKP